MFKKIISALLIIAAVMLSLSACGKKDPVTMVMSFGKDPLCLDPQIVETDEGKLIVSNCFEGLVCFDSEKKIVPGVAESWEISSDGFTYTFHLRKDAKWQVLKSYKKLFGTEDFEKTFDNRVTAYDFEFGLKRALNPVTQCNEAEKYFCIENAMKVNSGEMPVSSLGVKAVDDTTLVITLERKNPDFLRLLTLAPAMPCKETFFNETHAKYGLGVEYTLCNGPYYLSRWVEDNTLVMRKSDNYKRDNKVTVDAVYFNINKDESSVLTKLKQQSYACAFVSDSARAELADTKGINYLRCENTVSGLCFNCNDTVLQNADLRRALVAVTKLDKIEKPEEAVSPANGIVPESCLFGEETYRAAAGKIPGIAYNEAAAQALWLKGLTELEETSVEIKIICTSDYTAQMQNAIQNWQKVFSTSIVAKVETLSDEKFSSAVKNGNYMIAVGSISDSTASAIDTLKGFTTESRANIFGYTSEAYDKLIEQIINEDAGDKILADCKAAEQMLINDAVFCPLHTYSEYLATAEDVTGLFMTPDFKGIVFMNGGMK
ncbi:MAG: peptide ABC transporter substrate-binding protein [Clostridia bacterium]|nr:peptide ABC transporter substrate-binding protein [Clostridia bacterium]